MDGMGTSVVGFCDDGSTSAEIRPARAEPAGAADRSPGATLGRFFTVRRKVVEAARQLE
jgi:hypothetical protein